ncbi:MAG: hypothetical protein K0R67_1317 [Paenibacillus sp.]|jgi:hypothetical protein|nr:hypothetical protein [Paenibacillus sp.]
MQPKLQTNKVNLSSLEGENILSIAIRTELHLNKSRMHLLMDFNNNHDFIKELSKNITHRMQNLQQITDGIIGADHPSGAE